MINQIFPLTIYHATATTPVSNIQNHLPYLSSIFYAVFRTQKFMDHGGQEVVSFNGGYQ